jgi:hypothetical protein
MTDGWRGRLDAQLIDEWDDSDFDQRDVVAALAEIERLEGELRLTQPDYVRAVERAEVAEAELAKVKASRTKCRWWLSAALIHLIDYWHTPQGVERDVGSLIEQIKAAGVSDE